MPNAIQATFFQTRRSLTFSQRVETSTSESNTLLSGLLCLLKAFGSV